MFLKWVRRESACLERDRAKESRLHQVRSRANAAFREKDYTKADALYESIKDELSPAESRKLEYSKKRAWKPGPRAGPARESSFNCPSFVRSVTSYRPERYPDYGPPRQGSGAHAPWSGMGDRRQTYSARGPESRSYLWDTGPMVHRGKRRRGSRGGRDYPLPAAPAIRQARCLQHSSSNRAPITALLFRRLRAARAAK